MNCVSIVLIINPCYLQVWAKSQDSCVSLVHLWRYSWSFAYWTPVLLSKPFVNTAHMVLMFTLHCTNLFTFHVFLLEHQVSVSQNAGCRTIIIQCPEYRCLFRQVIAGNMTFQKANNMEIHCWTQILQVQKCVCLVEGVEDLKQWVLCATFHNISILLFPWLVCTLSNSNSSLHSPPSS